MTILFIGSTGDRAGHSLLTWAVGRRLLDKGRRVGFFKPFGARSAENEGLSEDPDALFFREAFGLRDPPEWICPYPWSEEGWGNPGAEEVVENCRALSKKLSQGRDILIVMGSKHVFFDEFSPPVSDVSLAKALEADVLLVHRYRNASRTAYTLLSVYSLLKDAVKGVVVNRAPHEELQAISDTLIPSLARKGVQVIAAVPDLPALSVRSLREIVAALRGEVLWGEASLDRPVGQSTSGSTALKGKAVLFKRLYHKIVFLSPLSPADSSKEAHNQPPVAAVLLTAATKPPPQLLEAARAEDIPLISVREDAFSALDRLERSPDKLDPRDESKIGCFTEWLDRAGALDRLVLSLG